MALFSVSVHKKYFISVPVFDLQHELRRLDDVYNLKS